MNGAGSSYLGPRHVSHPDTLRKTTKGRNAQSPEGCAYEQSSEFGGPVKGCNGPPDWKVGKHHYCIDHVDQMLCCGHRLTKSQRAAVLARPERRRWLARQRQLELAAEEVEPDFDPIVGSQIDHPFSWREHQARKAK